MEKKNYINLFNYCSKHLIDKDKSDNIHMFNKITKNLEKKIKNSLIDNKTFIILQEGDYNKTISNILPKLKKHIYPFNIKYRKKTYNEMSVMEKMFDPHPYILIIDWNDYYNVSLELKLHNLIKKYIKYKINNGSFDFNFVIDTSKKTYESDDSNSSFDILK